MFEKMIHYLKYVFMLPMALIGIYVYKLALQPAIHQFYQPVPDMIKTYALVLLAAIIHVVLLGSLALKWYPSLLKMITCLIGVVTLVYVLSMAWTSLLTDSVFWSMVWLIGMLTWIMGVWAMRHFIFEPAKPTQPVALTSNTTLLRQGITRR